AREAEAQSRMPLQEAERFASRLETEAKTLAKLVLAPPGTRFAPVAEVMTVTPGYEAALGAALGEDLDAPEDSRAPARWAGALPSPGDPPLPPGAEPLVAHVAAP